MAQMSITDWFVRNSNTPSHASTRIRSSGATSRVRISGTAMIPRASATESPRLRENAVDGDWLAWRREGAPARRDNFDATSGVRNLKRHFFGIGGFPRAPNGTIVSSAAGRLIYGREEGDG